MLCVMFRISLNKHFETIYIRNGAYENVPCFGFTNEKLFIFFVFKDEHE